MLVNNSTNHSSWQIKLVLNSCYQHHELKDKLCNNTEAWITYYILRNNANMSSQTCQPNVLDVMVINQYTTYRHKMIDNNDCKIKPVGILNAFDKSQSQIYFEWFTRYRIIKRKQQFYKCCFTSTRRTHNSNCLSSSNEKI